jgi:hypothetical protein
MPAQPHQKQQDKHHRLGGKEKKKKKIINGVITPASGNHGIRKRESGEAIKCELSCIIARRQRTLLYKRQIDTMKHVNRQEYGSCRRLLCSLERMKLGLANKKG